MANKVKFGLKNVYYAIVTETPNSITYGTPVALKGGVNLTLSRAGDTEDFYADDINYFSTSANMGYEGDLEIALITDQFRTDVLGDVADSNGVIVESANAIPKNFALGFEVQGDDKARRTWLYYCSCSRPNIDASTKENTITPKTDTLTIKAMPRPTDEKIKAVCTDGGSGTTYADFFNAVYE